MGRRRIKGNMDIELAIDMLEMAPHLDHAVLFSGDGDFRRLVEAVQRRGVRVTVVSTIRSSPPMVSDDLRRQADSFIELQDLAPSIMRNHHPRDETRPASPGPQARGRQARTDGSSRSRSPELPAPAIRGAPAAGLPPADCPPADCSLCPRLAAFRAATREAHPDWFNAPVPSFGDPEPELLIVGLAPGLRGANRTGRPFTGDYAGDLLYRTLLKSGFATGEYGADPADGLELRHARITNAVRCVPPQNKPETSEIAACGRFLAAELRASPKHQGNPGARGDRAQRRARGQGPETGALQIRARRDARTAGRHAYWPTAITARG